MQYVLTQPYLNVFAMCGQNGGDSPNPDDYKNDDAPEQRGKDPEMITGAAK